MRCRRDSLDGGLLGFRCLKRPKVRRRNTVRQTVVRSATASHAGALMARGPCRDSIPSPLGMPWLCSVLEWERGYCPSSDVAAVADSVAATFLYSAFA